MAPGITPHIKDVVTFLIGGVQGASFGISSKPVGTIGVVDTSVLSARADLVFAAYVAQMMAASGTKGLLSDYTSQVRLTGVKSYLYSASSTADAVGASSAASVVGTGTSSLPPQCAVVATLLTPGAGRSFRGRSYLPLLSAGNVNPLQLGGGVALRIATGMANYLTAIRGITTGVGTWTPCIVGMQAPALVPTITAVKVDSVIDTQRRRRDKLVSSATATVSLIVP